MREALRNALSTRFNSSPQPPPDILLNLHSENGNVNPWNIDLLMEFILEALDSTSPALLETRNTQQELATALLQESFAFDPRQINALARLLSNEQLINLIITLLPSRIHHNTVAFNNLDQLVHLLTIRATTSSLHQVECNRLISANSTLANLILKKRMDTLAEPKHKTTLMIELLDNYSNYHWEDEPFCAFTEECLLDILPQLPEKEFMTYLSRYYTQHSQTHAEAIKLFITRLWDKISEPQLILSCLEQDKHIHQNPKLITLFLQVETVKKLFFKNFLKNSSNQELLNYLLFLLELDEKLLNTLDILDDILDTFCQRLFDASWLTNDPIQQWTLSDKAPLLARHFISKPSRLALLAKPSSTVRQLVQGYAPKFMQGYLITSAIDDLQYRAIIVMDVLTCNSEQIQTMALDTLIHYQKNPEELRLLFTNLEAAYSKIKTQETNRHLGFQKHYYLFKKACWDLLKTPEECYEETAATTLLTQELTRDHCFDWFLITLIKQKMSKETNTPTELRELSNSLAVIDSEQYKYFSPETIATLLLHSHSEQSKENWNKIPLLLKKSPPTEQSKFAQSLLEQIIKQKDTVGLTLSDSVFSSSDNLLIPHSRKTRGDSAIATPPFEPSSPSDRSIAEWDQMAIECDELINKIDIKSSRKPNNPNAESQHKRITPVEQAWAVISNLSELPQVLPQLNSSALEWLVENSPSEYLKIHFSGWLECLLIAGKFDDARIDILLTLLPHDDEFLEKLFNKKELSPYFPKLFLQFLRKPEYTPQLRLLFQVITAAEKTEAEKKSFLSTIQQTLLNENVAHYNPLLPEIMTTLLINLQQLPNSQVEAQTLIKNQLRLFSQLAKNSTNDEKQLLDLQQWIFNLLKFLQDEDSHWFEYILKSDEFASFAPYWLKNITDENRNSHPYTLLLLDHTTIKINPNLLQNNDYQTYLQQLLTNPPLLMHENERFEQRFKSLFKQLQPKKQKVLAKEILLHQGAKNQPSLLTRLTVKDCFTTPELYALFNESPSEIKGNFVVLFLHQYEQFAALSVKERNQLLLGLTHKQQLQDILESSLTIEQKNGFMRYITDHILQYHAGMATWINQLQLDLNTLILFTRYTCEPIYLTFIKNALEEPELTPLRNEFKKYLQQEPPANLNPKNTTATDNLLSLLIENTFLNPETGWRCNPKLLSTIGDPKTLQNIIEKQVQFLTELQDWQSGYSEYHDAETQTLETTIHTMSRWINKTPLLKNSLFRLIEQPQKSLCQNDFDTITNAIDYAQSIHPKEEFNALVTELAKTPRWFDTEENKTFKAWLFNQCATSSLADFVTQDTLTQLFENYVEEELSALLNENHRMINTHKASPTGKPSEMTANLTSRHQSLTVAAFCYRHDGRLFQRLSALQHLNFINNAPQTLAVCLNTYLPLFDTEEPSKIAHFLSLFEQLLNNASDRNNLISQLSPALLNQIMSRLLQSTEQYKHLIDQLIDAQEKTRYLKLIHTELTTILNQYKINHTSKNVTLADLTPAEILRIQPKDYNRILFIQRLLFRASALPEFEEWVGQGEREEQLKRSYFSADASLYDMILSLPESEDASASSNEQTKQYAPNLHQACYQFLTKENKVHLYGGLFEQWNKPPQVTDSKIIYHYLNLVAFFVREEEIPLADRLKLSTLLEQAHFPLETLDKLHRNCPCKFIHSLFLTHLLSRSDILTQIAGSSLLEKLHDDTNEIISQKRLQPYVQPIDLTLIPEQSLALLTSEAATTLFCSAAHFHQLNTYNIPSLLNRVGIEKRELLISYWIEVYASMPNYDIALLKLMGLYPEAVKTAFKKKSSLQQRTILLPLLKRVTEEKPITPEEYTALSHLINVYLTGCNPQSSDAITDQLLSFKSKIPSQRYLTQKFWENLGSTKENAKGHIIAYALKQTGEKFIRSLLEHKELREVIVLFAEALPHLNGDKKLTSLIQEAKAEANWELELQNKSFQRLRRCFHYGWTGFFVPNPPKYAFSSEMIPTKKDVAMAPRDQTKLNELLEKATENSALKELDELYILINYFEKEPKPAEELTIRKKTDELFTKLWQKQHSNPNLQNWLQNNQDAFLCNRNQLIARYCEYGQREKLKSLLEIAKQGPGEFDKIEQELFCKEEFKLIETPGHAPLTRTQSCLNQLRQLSKLPGQLWGYSSTRLQFWKEATTIDSEIATRKSTTESKNHLITTTV